MWDLAARHHHSLTKFGGISHCVILLVCLKSSIFTEVRS
jgi:hypothetical protein